MSDFYDRQGNPMTLMEWAKRFEGFDAKGIADYKRVAETTLINGRWVSTVWLGPTHLFWEGPPLIFETIVFDGYETFHELDCDRYSTEEEARAGHERMCEKWSVENPEEVTTGK